VWQVEAHGQALKTDWAAHWTDCDIRRRTQTKSSPQMRPPASISDELISSANVPLTFGNGVPVDGLARLARSPQ
jgi:hypothetical protein